MHIEQKIQLLINEMGDDISRAKERYENTESLKNVNSYYGGRLDALEMYFTKLTKILNEVSVAASSKVHDTGCLCPQCAYKIGG